MTGSSEYKLNDKVVTYSAYNNALIKHNILVKAKNSDASSQALKDLSANYAEKVFKTRLSVLDILEENKDIALPFATFVQMLPSMRIRQYSISSSPLWNPEHVTLTLSVVDAPARSGRNEPYLGVASTYLAGLRAGDKVQLAVRPSMAATEKPGGPSSTWPVERVAKKIVPPSLASSL